MANPYYPQPRPAAPVRPWLRAGALALAALLLGACASAGGPRGSRVAGHGPVAHAVPSAVAAASNDVLMRALGLVGTPYLYGGNTPQSGFDCSGLVDFVFLDAAGLRLPRSTRELIEFDAPTVGRDDLQPGDLGFFNPGGGQASHIGIYVGEGRFVHAPSSGGTVRLDALQSAYWQRSYQGAKRVLR
jgi:cell wall-associated NlpC family hydrolase